MRSSIFVGLLAAALSFPAYATGGGEGHNTGCNGRPCNTGGNGGAGGQGGSATSSSRSDARATAVAGAVAGAVAQGGRGGNARATGGNATGGASNVTVVAGGPTGNGRFAAQAPMPYVAAPAAMGCSWYVGFGGTGSNPANNGGGILSISMEAESCRVMRYADFLSRNPSEEAVQAMCTVPDFRQRVARCNPAPALVPTSAVADPRPIAALPPLDPAFRPY